MFRKSLPALAYVVAAFAAGSTNAAVVVDIKQIGSDVVASHSGTVNLSALAFWFTSAQTKGEIGGTDPHYYAFDEAAGQSYDGYRVADGFSGLGPFDGSTLTTTLDTASIAGDEFGFFSSSSSDYIYVPNNYVSGSQLSGSVTFFDTTLSTMGLTEGTYDNFATWGAGSSADSISLSVSIAAVPLPAGLPLLATALAGLLFAGRRRTQEREVSGIA